MILTNSLQIVELMLSPLYLLGSDLDPFPFHRVFSLELPQTLCKSKFVQRLFAIL